MACEICREIELEQAENTEDRVVKRGSVFRPVLRGLLWPFGIVVRTYRGFWWLLGFRQPLEITVVSPAVCSPAVSSPVRHSLAGRKRLHRLTRLLLSILPRWVQSAMGYPVSSSIGRSLSPEIRVSPTKPCGKGSKRKQDELDEEEEEESQTWVEALSQELADDDSPEQDPDYEPTTVDTESEEYCSHNDTESDFDVEEGIVVCDAVNMGVQLAPPSEVSFDD
ncbi:oogenesis-related isoform X2 [Etheostoma cragini]|uniref:oogenesis-related isoform X2 n=1 Tax=Etheostoma cragini TaxID=417921 RepID=UPI00155EFB8E|nr:oogenesis-related isoform X2 [Etheostoma cragini]